MFRRLSTFLRLTVLTGLLGLSAATAGDGTFTYQSLTCINKVVPQSNAYYTIGNRVMLEGPYFVFDINGASGGSYRIKGITGLIKTTHEISVIEVFRATPQGNQIWTGAKNSFEGLATGSKQIVLHPGDSTAAIGRAIGRTGRSVGRLLTGLINDEPASSTGADLSKTAGGMLAGDQARLAAYELHLDAYSANPSVQAILGEIARQRWAGSLGISAANFVIPGISLASTLANGALTPGAYVDSIERMIRDNPAPELNRELERMMRESMRWEQYSPEMSHFRAFLNNPNYTPRQKAYVSLYLQRFSTVGNLAGVTQTLGSASTIENAEILYNQMQLLCATHDYGKPLRSFAVARERIAGVMPRGEIIYILPYDYVDDTEQMRQELENFPAAGDGSRNLWVIGQATQAFAARAKSAGVSSIQINLLNFPAFQQAARPAMSH